MSDATVRPTVASRRRIAGSAAALLVATGGPSVYASLHVFHVPGSWSSFTYVYPFGAIGIAGVTLLAGHLRGRRLRDLPWQFAPIAAYLAWAALSSGWSASPQITPVAVGLDIGVVAFGCWFGLALTIDEQISAVALAPLVAVLVSLPLIAWRPEYARAPRLVASGGEWMGIFGNQNSLAAAAALGLVGLAGFVALRPSRRRVAAVAPLAVAELVALWFTRSDTSRFSLLVAVLSCACMAVVPALRRRRVPGTAVVVAIAAALGAAWVVVFGNLHALADRLGFDPTFSSRTYIWRDVRRFIAVHPVRGYGFWGFWDNPDLTAVTYAYIGKYYGSAHNSVLEELLMLGVIGLVLYLGVAVASFGGVLRWVWRERSVSSCWWLALVVYLVLENLSESWVLWHSYNWILFVAAGFASANGLRDRRADVCEDGAGEVPAGA